eukprot:4679317-Amphidinium_carterae.2
MACVDDLLVMGDNVATQHFLVQFVGATLAGELPPQPPIVAMAAKGDFNVMDLNGNPMVTIDRTSPLTMVAGPTEPTEETMPTLQQPRPKAPSRATPSTMEPVVRIALTVATNPTSPPERPTGHNGPTGPSTTTPMDTGDAEAEDNAGIPMHACAPWVSSAASSRPSTIDRPVVNGIVKMMWEHAVSKQCSPIVLDALQRSWYCCTLRQRAKAQVPETC